MARHFFALEWNGRSTMQSAVTRANVPKMTMPYRSFALLYDALLGNAMFPLIRRNFEWVVRRYGIRFRSAADVACGTGAFVRYLCQWGVPVVGVDRATVDAANCYSEEWREWREVPATGFATASASISC